MPLDRIDHFSIRTLKLEETRTFYENAMGMEAGDRPPLPFPGYWLYLGDHAVIHLIGIDENNPEGLNEYLGEVNVTELSGGGAVDHLAFRASGSKDLIDRSKNSKRSLSRTYGRRNEPLPTICRRSKQYYP